jgi:uncharacterized SAM-binding protein YcdF (DUF218 family)
MPPKLPNQLSLVRTLRRQRWLRFGLSLALVVMIAPYLLTAWGLWLRPVDDLEHADAIFVPNGDQDFARTRHATALLLQGYGRWLIVSGQGAGGDSAPLMAAEARRMGLAADRILIEPDATSTAENAWFSRPLLAQNRIRRVLVVSSPLHLRRMALCARTAWPGVTVRTRADDEPFNPWWWLDPAGWDAVGTETGKIILYALRGDLSFWPFRSST